MPHVELPAAEFKVVLLGSSHIGKSSLVTRFSEGYYRENSRQPTVGAAFVTKRIQSSENVTCKVQIWDTAGQPNFKAMASMFYKDAAAVIVCYDVGCRKSFDEMREWLDELRQKTTAGEVVVAIAALKADLMMQQDVNYDASSFVPEREVEQLADALGLIYLPTSAKADQNVRELFQRVADQVLQNHRDARIHKRNGDSNHHMETDDTISNGGNGHQHAPSSYNLTSPENNEYASRRSTPRRSKRDKNYQINTESESQKAPPLTPKSKRKTKIIIDSGKRKGSRTPKSKSKKDNTLLENESGQNTSKTYGCCQPVGCGAGEGIDGGSGCIVS